MSDAAVRELARAAGLLVDWEDASGEPQTVTPESLRAILAAMRLPCGTADECADSRHQLSQGEKVHFITADLGRPIRLHVPQGPARLTLEGGEVRDVRISKSGMLPGILHPGYHRLEHRRGEVTLAVAPPRCFGIADAADGRRHWGAAVQIYALRGERSAAFGDFAALADFSRAAAARGADAVAISPVHALFVADPGRYSPYSPSSRQYLNPLFADPALLGDWQEAEEGEALIDWLQASPARLACFRTLYRRFSQDEAFRAFERAADKGLQLHALFEALHGHFFTEQQAGGWQAWPAEFQDPQGPAVEAFARDHQDEIRFHLFLQWLADRSLAEAQKAAKGAGMVIGLIADLAVGLDPGGSHAWSHRDELLTGLGVGAPPDAFQAAGQNWGITSFSPAGLKRTGFQPFLAMLRAATRHAGGLRIDHALGLRRLWVVPSGASPLEGAYLRYPEQDLLRLIALESHRARAIVVGEDLGVVPRGFRGAIGKRGLLGMRVLPFERRGSGSFVLPDKWDVHAVAMTSTHDLPPIAGWWRGHDIEWRAKLGAAGDREEEAASRAADREQLWKACVKAGAATGPTPSPDEAEPVVDAAVDYTARAACELAIIPAEDLFAIEEAPNLPGTVDEHPNWRRRLPDRSEALFAQPTVARRIDRINAARRS